MTKLPTDLSGKELVKILSKIGFVFPTPARQPHGPPAKNRTSVTNKSRDKKLLLFLKTNN
jgi:hypothetical protein